MATYTAASCTQAAVQAAITAQQVAPVDGDIIQIPACSSTAWTTGISQTFTTSVTIQGAGAISATTGGASTTGTDQTTLLDHIAGSAPLFIINTTAGKSFRMTGLAISQDTPTSSQLGAITIGGSSTSVRVDHCHFFMTVPNVDLFFRDSVLGVADHNFFDSSGQSASDVTFTLRFENGATWNGDTAGFGDKSWTDTEHWGSSQFFFVEDNQFLDGSLSDSHLGARYVYRYNTITGPASMQVYNHGETPGDGRAVRAAEFYGNNINNTANNGNPPFSLNSGTLLYWGNTVTGGFRGVVSVGYDFRTTAGGGGTYFYGDSWHFCGTPAGGPTNWDGNLDSSGYACIDQPGRGAGQLLTGVFTTGGGGKINSVAGNVAWPHQALSPIYVWHNSYTPQFYTDPALFPAIREQCNGVCAENREYYQQFGTYFHSGTFNGTVGIGEGTLVPTNASAYTNAPNCTAGTDPMTGGAAPGVGYWHTPSQTLYVCTATNTWTAYYTPYTYPHPLAAGQAGGGSGGTTVPGSIKSFNATFF